MLENLLQICIAFSVAMYLLYWLLIFRLTDNIFDESRINKLYRIPIAIVGTGVVIWLYTFTGQSQVTYAFIFILLIANFVLLYKDSFAKVLFCASSCILHIMALRTIITGVVALVMGMSMHQVSASLELTVISLGITGAITNLACIGVTKFIPSTNIKIINQHREQQWFMTCWMSVFNVYLLYHSKIFNNTSYHPSAIGDEIFAPLCILLGLYIVLFFAFKTASILGYKEKNAVLEQTVYQEQQYRSSATKDAVATYEMNITRDALLKGLEGKSGELRELEGKYSDILVYMSHSMVYSDDIERFLQYGSPDNLIREYQDGRSETIIEYRRLFDNGEYAWVRCVTNVVEEMDTGDLIAFVCIKDIDSEKRKQLELQYKAERDPLTGLYNKELTGKLIDEKLAFHASHSDAALFMVDVDNFKNINDNFGHVYGDAVLCELADKLCHIFRADDVIGRIGGDEYIAFMKNGATVKRVEEKSQAICNAFYTVYNGQNDEKYTISSSIGVAISPRDGSSFEELYQHADVALYESKGKGKNTYAIYSGKSFSGYQHNRTEIKKIGEIVPRSFRQNRIEYVFKILYQSESPVAAIHSALELVASHFSFERGYIFETSMDGKTTSNTFEWCANGVTPEIDTLQNVPIEAVATANSYFQKAGTFILRTLDDLQPIERAVLEPQGIKSMFQFGIFDNNNLLGFIGFDNCKSESVPSDTEIDELATICNILATFFVKQHIGEESAKSLSVLVEVMNYLDNYIYVINSETFQVLFMNEKVRVLLEDNHSSEPCYSFFRGNESQCHDCPMRKLDESSSHKAHCEIYNKKLHLWMETSATSLRWSDGSSACLISCVDITKHKEAFR